MTFVKTWGERAAADIRILPVSSTGEGFAGRARRFPPGSWLELEGGVREAAGCLTWLRTRRGQVARIVRFTGGDSGAAPMPAFHFLRRTSSRTRFIAKSTSSS